MIQNVQLPSLDSLRSACVLPPSWSDQLTGNKLTLTKVEETRPEHGAEILSCVSIESDLSWKVFVYGKEVAIQSCSLLRSFGDKINSSSLPALLGVVDRSNICEGNYEDHFVSLVELRKGAIKSANGVVSAYVDDSVPACGDGDICTKTVRSSNCELITDQNKCNKCIAYRKNLRALHSRQKKESTQSKQEVEVESHTNYRYLSSPEKKSRMTNLHSKTRALGRQVDQLKKRIEHLTALNGVNLDQTLDGDIREIVNEHDAAVSSSYSSDSFECLFWKQQKECMLLKNSKQMRWHPMLIKWCIHLRMLSSSCYNSLRSTGVLHLPSERTLRDYTNVITAKSGFQCEVDEQLFKEAKMEELDDHQKYIALIFDEVKIKEDLVYNKHSGEMIGFVNVTDINHHLSAFEQQCHSEVLSHSFATHMLVFMVRGLFSTLEFPYVQFPIASSTGDVIHPLVWQCIEHLELIGLKVLAVVCDGATPNRNTVKTVVCTTYRDGMTFIPNCFIPLV
ncbi:hypothetical protein SPONN_7 [uncultured Candidatus Thioglobus sp.]|nr:hypothetical protein SPONN_7 [uncultured Candidatus Thioglobus sp.]